MTLKAEDTLMFKEAAEAGDKVARQFAANEDILRKLGDELRARPPRFVVTCARGSSDHAATFAKYVFETQLGRVTASAAPSVSSIYAAAQTMEDVLFLAISQSGKSPDLVNQTKAAKAAGARVVALVNVTDSPLAEIADCALPLHAGPEKSVAATKSYICSLAAILQLAAHWKQDAALRAALEGLPDVLRTAWTCDWSHAVEALSDARHMFVIGRGLGLGVAQEAALKFKETCGLHAEAFSAAEVKHGPMAIVGKGFPVLCFAQKDETLPGIETLIEDFRARAAKVLYAGPDGGGAAAPWRLPVIEARHAATAPLLLIQSFYRMVNALAVARGFNPDVPPHLNKVTETV